MTHLVYALPCCSRFTYKVFQTCLDKENQEKLTRLTFEISKTKECIT